MLGQESLSLLDTLSFCFFFLAGKGEEQKEAGQYRENIALTETGRKLEVYHQIIPSRKHI